MKQQTSNTKKITTETTQKVADLIKLKISAEEVESYTEQLETVLESVDVLQELDTQGIPESSQTHGLTNVLREDEATEGLDMSKYKNDKNFKNGYFVVDKVI